jgi:fucose permease
MRRWRVALSITFSLGGIALASWVARLPAIRDYLGASTLTMSWLLAAIAVGSVAGLIVANPVVARLGARRALAIALGVGPVAFLFCGIGVATDSFTLVFCALVLFGMSISIADVAMNVQGVATERVTGRTMMPGYHAFFSIGNILGAILGTVCERLDVPIVTQTAAIAIVMAVVGQVAVRSLQSEHVDADETDAAESGSNSTRTIAWREPLTLLLGVIAFGMAFAEGSANDWLALSSVDDHGTSHEVGAIVLGVFVTGMTVGRLAGSRVIDRFGRVTVLRVSAAVAVVGLALYIFTTGPVLPIVGVALWGLGAALGFPMTMSAAGEDPRRAAARVTVVSSIGYCAFLAGPPLIGLLGSSVGLLLALIPVLALVAVSGLLAPAVAGARARSAAR